MAGNIPEPVCMAGRKEGYRIFAGKCVKGIGTDICGCFIGKDRGGKVETEFF